MRFRDDGTWKNLNHHLVMRDRPHAGHEASPSAGVIDTQSVKTTEAGVPCGIDAAKEFKGRKRHALADTDGRSWSCKCSLPRSRTAMVPLRC